MILVNFFWLTGISDDLRLGNVHKTRSSHTSILGEYLRIGEYQIFIYILGCSHINWRVMARTDFHIHIRQYSSIWQIWKCRECIQWIMTNSENVWIHWSANYLFAHSRPTFLAFFRELTYVQFGLNSKTRLRLRYNLRNLSNSWPCQPDLDWKSSCVLFVLVWENEEQMTNRLFFFLTSEFHAQLFSVNQFFFQFLICFNSIISGFVTNFKAACCSIKYIRESNDNMENKTNY